MSRRRPIRDRRWPLAGLALTAFAAGCTSESVEAAADREALDLLSRARAASYADWAPMPDFDPHAPSAGPHGQTSTIYLNRILADAIADGPPWPADSMVVKEGRADGEIVARALMHKDAGGWFYALFDADDRIVAAGPAMYCVDCHDDGLDQLLSAPDPSPGD